MKKKFVLCRREVSGPLDPHQKFCNRPITEQNVFDFCAEDLKKFRGMWAAKADEREAQEAHRG